MHQCDGDVLRMLVTGAPGLRDGGGGMPQGPDGDAHHHPVVAKEPAPPAQADALARVSSIGDITMGPYIAAAVLEDLNPQRGLCGPADLGGAFH